MVELLLLEQQQATDLEAVEAQALLVGMELLVLAVMVVLVQHLPCLAHLLLTQVVVVAVKIHLLDQVLVLAALVAVAQEVITE
jgi:hypothetical protein